MTKVLRIEDSGFVWEVPAEKIAENRAIYYAKRDKDTTYEEEFSFTMGDDYELRDWFLNNMNWSDVKDSARFIASPPALAAPRTNNEFYKVEVVTNGCICQDQQRRGYCTEPGCAYAHPMDAGMRHTQETMVRLDGLDPGEEIGCFDGSGQWIALTTVQQLRKRDCCDLAAPEPCADCPSAADPSAPPVRSSLPSGESDPVAMPDYGGAETVILTKIEAEARRYAEMYAPSSDGRNTFVIFADWVAGLAVSRPHGESHD